MRAVRAAKDSSETPTGFAAQLGRVIDDPKGFVAECILQAMLPLVKDVVEELSDQEPQKRNALLALWLLEHSGAPAPLVTEVQYWSGSNAHVVCPPEGGKIGDPSPKTKTVKQALPNTGGTKSPPPGAQADASNTGATTPAPDEAPATGGPPEKRVSVNDDDEHDLWQQQKADSDEEEEDDDDEQDDEQVFQVGRRQSSKKGSAVGSPRQGQSQLDEKPHPVRNRRFTVDLSSLMRLALPPVERIIEVLGQVPMLKKVPVEDLKKIAGIAKCTEFRENENIICHGGPSDTLHLIMEGTGKVCIPHQIGTFGQNDFFGEKALALASSTHEMQVSACGGPVTTVSIAAADFQQLGIQTTLSKARQTRKARQRDRSEGDNAGIENIKDGVCPETGRRIMKEYKQTLSDRQVITTAVKNNRMLGEVLHLSEQQYNLIADLVYLIALEQDEVLFNKGDTTGNALYIIQEGVVHANVSDDLHGSFRLLTGDSFGEVALLHKTPQSASIIATKSTCLWVLRHAAFQNVAALAYKERIEDYVSLISKIPCLNSAMAEANWDLVANVLEEFVVDEGDDICSQGEDEGLLFIIFKGECAVIKDGEAQQTLTKGDWIGEDALTQNIHANVTVRATSDVATVLSLEYKNFRAIVQAVTAMEKKKPSSEPGKRSSRLRDKINNLCDKEKMADEFLKTRMSKGLRRNSKQLQTLHDIHQTTRIGTFGEGSFGSVVLLKDEANDRFYALKALDKDHIEREKMGKSVQNERTVQGMIDSEFVVRLYATYQDKHHIYFLMEPVMGGELFDVYAEQKLFGDLNVARFYIACVTLGLQALHSKRVIYRDLKLENVLVGEDGYGKLTDMGIAKIVIGKTYTVCGTADYFAPETLKQQGHNRAVDWWACGVLLFIMVTGRSPFDAPAVTDIYKNIMKGFSKVKFLDSIPSDITEVIKSLCRKKPEERITMQKAGVEGLREMGYFMGLRWDELEDKKLDPPHKPEPPNFEKIAKRKLTREINLEVENITLWDGSLPEVMSDSR